MKKILLITVALLFLLSACQQVDFFEEPPIIDTGVDPESWVEVPAGPFLQGQFNKEAVIENGFDIMVTPVTNAQFAAFLNDALAAGAILKGENQIEVYYSGDTFNAGRHEEEISAGNYIVIPLDDPYIRLTYDGITFSVAPGWENHPMTVVSWFGAKAYCEFKGGRLPTELEWEKAARGTDGRAFPWGDTIERNQANFYFSRDPFENMSTYGSRTTPVGLFNGEVHNGFVTLDGASPFGAYDMAGNVWEWTADIYDSQHYRYMRGGSKDMYENNLRVWVRNNATPTFTSPGTGFRCVRDTD